MNNRVYYDGKAFELFISEEKISDTVDRLAQDISKHYAHINEPLVLISILDGSFIFMADLIRSLDLEVSIQFVKLKSYQGTTSRGEVAHILKLQEDIKGKYVLVIEDIVDTGLTLEVFIEELRKKEPAEIKVCSLLSKPEVHNNIIDLDFVGMEIPPDFIIGYGLDLNGLGRQLPEIYRLVV